jgi:hypothetical protein
VSASAGVLRGSVKEPASAGVPSTQEIHDMKRFAFFTTRSIALVGAVLLTLAMSGCGTMTHPMSADATAGLIPSSRGAL